MKNIKVFLGGGLFLALGVFFIVFLQPKTPQKYTGEQEQVSVKKSPTFTLNNLDGKPVVFKGASDKVTMIHFWATWCQPCKKEVPSLEALYQKLNGRPFEIFAISLDKDNVKAVKTFQQEMNMKIPILLDSKEEVKGLFQISGVPETFIVSPQGEIIKHVIGSFEWDSPQVLEFFEKTLTESFQ